MAYAYRDQSRSNSSHRTKSHVFYVRRQCALPDTPEIASLIDIFGYSHSPARVVNIHLVHRLLATAVVVVLPNGKFK